MLHSWRVCAGARQVTLLDREPKALQCALLTAAASGLKTAVSAAAFSDSEEESVELQRFTQCLQASTTPYCRAGCTQDCMISASIFNWNDGFVGEQYDTVIACDVLYEEVAVEPLARLLPKMLACPAQVTGRILLTDPQDRTPKNRTKFLDLLAHHDPSLVVEFVKTIDVQHPTASGAPVKVLSMPLHLLLRTHYAGAIIITTIAVPYSLQRIRPWFTDAPQNHTSSLSRCRRS